MQFQRSGQHDDRRRRVLTEEVIGSGLIISGKAKGGSTTQRASAGDSSLARAAAAGHRTDSTTTKYGEAAEMDRQPRVTDLIPHSYVAFFLWFAAGIAVVAGLECLYAYMPEMATMSTDGYIAALDLDGEGSLSAWFSSAVLAMAGAVALLIYTVRRHRADDYHGRYRIWLWSAGCWFLMSIDESGSLHEGFKEMMTHATGQRLLGDGSVWWIGPYLLLLGVVGTRLLLEMRSCRLSSLSLLATAGCFVVAVATQLGWVLPDAGARGVMLEEGCEMVGNLLLLAAMGLHARYVILQAQGLIIEKKKPPPPPQPEKAKRRNWFGKAQVDPPHDGAAPGTRRIGLGTAKKPARATPSAIETTADEQLAEQYEDEPRRRDSRKRPGGSYFDQDESQHDIGKLSKAQRKALRRQKENQRRADLQ